MTSLLTTAEFQVAWDLARLGDLPLILRVAIDRPPCTDDQRASQVAAVLDRLQAAGLAGPGGLAPWLADALALLANPQWAINAWLAGGPADQAPAEPGTVRAYGAANEDTAALAVLVGNQVTVTPSTACRLPADITALAGPAPPGEGHSINLPAETLCSALASSHGDRDQLIDELVGRGVQRGAAGTIAAITGHTRRHGQCSAEVMDADGVRRPVAGTVDFCDTAIGRWAQLRTTERGGSDWVTITPASAEQLAAMVADRVADRLAGQVANQVASNGLRLD